MTASVPQMVDGQIRENVGVYEMSDYGSCQIIQYFSVCSYLGVCPVMQNVEGECWIIEMSD
jgi:hypothetical protein